MKKLGFKEKVLSMKRPKEGLFYYCITLLGTEDGNISSSCFSHWVGYTETKPRREIRAASLVNPERMIESWNELGQPYVVVNNEEDLCIYLLMGGNALIEESIGKKRFKEIISPKEVGQSGFVGFEAIANMPAQALNRAPSPKLRMEVLKRDDFRCKICGRRPADHTDVELHVHHVRQWGHGGLTDKKNLTTLCHTCHKGLDPHEDPSLSALISKNFDIDVERDKRELIEGIIMYRKIMNTELISQAPKTANQRMKADEK